MSFDFRYKIFCLSPSVNGRQQEKAFNTDKLYLNYGLLGLATLLSEMGHQVKMMQSDGMSLDVYRPTLEYYLERADILMVSLPSFFEIPMAQDILRFVREKYPKIRVMLGGRWTVDRNLGFIQRKFAGLIHMICRGCPDDRLSEVLAALMAPDRNRESPFVSQEYQYSKPFPHVDYKLLHDFKKYQPVIEASRGCPGKCKFCQESNYTYFKLKSTEAIIDEIESICEQYKSDDLNFYLQGAMVNPDVEWAKAFKKLYDERQLRCGLRFESRVDCLNPESVKILAGAGLKVIDFGLESASPTMLRRMNKTSNPEDYLKKAEAILSAASEVDVKCKLNILLFAGETQRTWGETMAWLRRMKAQYGNGFGGVSANPLTIYLNGEGTEDFSMQVERDSGCKVNRIELNERGYTTPDTSRDISSLKACAEAAYRALMTDDEYKYLKSISFTPRETSIEADLVEKIA